METEALLEPNLEAEDTTDGEALGLLDADAGRDETLGPALPDKDRLSEGAPDADARLRDREAGFA